MKFSLILSFILGILLFNASETKGQWIQTNGPYCGNINCMAISDADLSAGQTSIFAGTWANGIFHSTNYGKNWTAVNNGLPARTTVWSLVISPIGTGSNRGSGYNVFAGTFNGVYFSSNNGSSWAAVNNGLPANSTINSLTVSLIEGGTTGADSTIIFAGTSSNGVYLSSNNGSNWVAVNAGLPANADISSLVPAPAEAGTTGTHGNNIFAGTYGSGIFLSTNNGTSWRSCGFNGSYVWSLAASDTIIYAGIRNSISSGVKYSTDNGTTWNKTSLNNPNVDVITVSPLAAGSALGVMKLFAGTGDGFLYQSSDNGTNWDQINTGWGVNPPIDALGVFSDGINTSIIAGTHTGMYLSTNNGSSWVESNTGITGITFHALTASGTSLFAGTETGIFLSTDNGTSWNTVNKGFINGGNEDAYSLTVSPTGTSPIGTSGTSIFAGGDDNAYFSNNNGASWSPIGKSGHFLFNSLAACPLGAGGNYLFAVSSYNSGIFSIFSNGISWSSWNWADSGTFASSVTSSFAILGASVFAGNSQYGVFLSTNFGASWNAVNNDLINTHVTALTVSRLGSSGQNLFAGTSTGIFLSTNNGTSWNAVNNGLPNTAVNVLADYGPNIFAGTGSNIFLSTNNGISWAEVNTGLPPGFVPVSFAISGMNIFAAANSGLWRRPLSELIPSTWQADINIKDNGNTSQSLIFGESPIATDSLDAGLGEAQLPPAAFGFDARFHLPNGDDSWKDYRSADKDSDDWIIIFQPGDGGYPITFTWDNSKLPTGNFYLKDNINGTFVNVNMKTSNSYTLTNTGISELQIQAEGLPTAVETKVDRVLPDIYSLSQNYPNPFNPSTVIRYGLRGISNVKIKIYNLLGQEVESLVNDFQGAGYHEVTWNASNKASGVYFYSFQANSVDGKEKFSSVKKMILLK